MKNAVGREIPEDYLKDGKEAFNGSFYRNNIEFKRAVPKQRASLHPEENKLLKSLDEVLEKCNIKDGSCISFHHHFRNGDHIVNLVMDAINERGIKGIYICASSLGAAQRPIVKYIKDGTITGISSSGVRDQVGKAISNGDLRDVAMIRSHGGRVRAIESGDVKIDIAFIGAPTSDVLGNARGKGGKSDCGVLAYADVDARYAEKVVVLTDTIVPTPNAPASIKAIDVDYVVEVDSVGDANKIASEVMRITTDPRELKIAEDAAKVVASTEYFKNGFSFQTGAGGSSLAVTRFLKQYMDEKEIKMGWALGGITEPMVKLQQEGYIETLLDTQDFDVPSVKSVNETIRHYEISTSEYANPFNKGAYVNYLDYVILGALEIDTHFNVNVVQGSDGVIQGAPGGHVDTSAGSKVTIIVAPLIRSRISTIKDKVTSVTTPGESVDVLVTEYGVAVNPNRPDLLESLEHSGLKLKTIEELKDEAYKIVGKPAEIKFKDSVVALVEYRDGTIIDVIYQI